MPLEVIKAFAHLKKSAAKANQALGVLDQAKADLISKACDEILDGKLMTNSLWWYGKQAQAHKAT